MTGHDVIRSALRSSEFVFNCYMDDFTDAELLIRPVPGSNHMAWQLGHLIVSEQMLIKGEMPDAAYPALPQGFAEKHSKDSTGADQGFSTKAQYVDLFHKTRQATIVALDRQSDADLSKSTSGRMAQFFPKRSDLFMLISNHVLMHSGQFAVVRRKLSKPIVI